MTADRGFTRYLTYSCHDDSNLVPKFSGGKGKEKQLIAKSRGMFFKKYVHTGGKISKFKLSGFPQPPPTQPHEGVLFFFACFQVASQLVYRSIII
jgi:hypothetical protein